MIEEFPLNPLAEQTDTESGQQRTLSAFLNLVLEVAGSLEPRTVIRHVLEQGVEATKADRATLSSIAGDTLVIEASAGPAGEVTWIGLTYGQAQLLQQPQVVKMLATRLPVLGGPMDRTAAAPELVQGLAKAKHTALVPILDGADVVGMLALSRFEDQPFTPAEVPALRVLGALAGLALRNAKLYERATDTARRLSAAIEAAADVGSTKDLPVLIDRILVRAARAAGADSASVTRLDAGSAVIEATSGIAPVGTRLPLPDFILSALVAGAPAQVDLENVTFPAEVHGFAEPYAHALVTPLLLGGEMTGMLVVARHKGSPPFEVDDIAALQQFSSLAALLLSNARLLQATRDAERQKAEFLDIAVHELRGPLTVVEGYASMMVHGDFGELPQATQRPLDIILKKASAAQELTTDLLTVARIESDDLVISHHEVTVCDLVQDAVDRARARAEMEHGEIVVDCPPNAVVVGDSALIARILDNLVGNALTYVREFPHISIAVLQGTTTVEIRVRDNGMGIPDDERSSVFERFVRGSKVLGQSGSGLGLYVSRECARRMDGDLILESSSEIEGSVFTLLLPASAKGSE